MEMKETMLYAFHDTWLPFSTHCCTRLSLSKWNQNCQKRKLLSKKLRKDQLRNGSCLHRQLFQIAVFKYCNEILFYIHALTFSTSPWVKKMDFLNHWLFYCPKILHQRRLCLGKLSLMILLAQPSLLTANKLKVIPLKRANVLLKI